MAFSTQTISGINTNSSAAATAGIDVRTQSCLAWTVQGATGDHDNHKITLQLSLDNTNWIDYGHLTGINVLANLALQAIGYIRFRVKEAEGATSTVNIVINAK